MFNEYIEDEAEEVDEHEDTDRGNMNWVRRGYKKQKKGFGGFKRKYAKMEFDEDEEEEEGKDKVPEKLLWKMVKAKYIYTFKLCKECNNRLFNDSKKFAYAGNLLRLTMLFCQKCVHINVAATDLLEGTGLKKRANDKWKN